MIVLNKRKKLAQEAILLSMDKVKQDIVKDNWADFDDLRSLAEIMVVLTHAWRELDEK